MSPLMCILGVAGEGVGGGGLGGRIFVQVKTHEIN